MKSTRALTALPLPVRRALRQIGADISIARRRRQIGAQMMAERAFISRSTLSRAEKGDPTVAMGIYATILFILGLTDRLASLADPAADRVGLELAEESLPRRIRLPRSASTGSRHDR